MLQCFEVYLVYGNKAIQQEAKSKDEKQFITYCITLISFKNPSSVQTTCSYYTSGKFKAQD